MACLMATFRQVVAAQWVASHVGRPQSFLKDFPVTHVLTSMNARTRFFYIPRLGRFALLSSAFAPVRFGFHWLDLVASTEAGAGVSMSPMPRFILPPAPAWIPPPGIYTPPAASHYTAPPVQSLTPPVAKPGVQDNTTRQFRDQMNLNQTEAQQRQNQRAADEASRSWRDEMNRNEARMQETPSRVAVEASQRRALGQMNWAATQAGRTGSSNPPLRSTETPQLGASASIHNGSTGNMHNDVKTVTRFAEAAQDTPFYSPNDPERRYKWVEVSPTTARSLVNGRTAALPAGMTVIVVGQQPYSSGYAGGQPSLGGEPGYDSTAGYNTLRINNPSNYRAQVNLRSGSRNFNKSVGAQNTGSV